MAMYLAKMMNPDVIIVGAGIAGISAASILAKNNLNVLILDQAMAIGGNLHVQSLVTTERTLFLKHQIQQWSRLSFWLNKYQQKITLQCSTRFIGIDHQGTVMTAGLSGANNNLYKPKALILATGATEIVKPINGWELSGVMTAGAIQRSLKLLSKPFSRNIVLAGSGPLLLIVGAQLVEVGTPPLAIIEGGEPFRHLLKGISLPFNYKIEASAYYFKLLKARVPFYSGAKLQKISRNSDNGMLNLTKKKKSGEGKIITTNIVGLHDGLNANNYGTDFYSDLIIKRAGDCRNIMGAKASEIDGLNVGMEVVSMLTESEVKLSPWSGINSHLKAQKTIREIYKIKPSPDMFCLDDETIICRCEGIKFKDLKTVGNPTVREARLSGRLCMGACQGRFCANFIEEYLSYKNTNQEQIKLMGNRWPVRPVSIRDFVNTTDLTSNEGQIAPVTKNPADRWSHG